MSVSSCLSFELVRYPCRRLFLAEDEGCGGLEGSWVKGFGGVLAFPYIFLHSITLFLVCFLSTAIPDFFNLEIRCFIFSRQCIFSFLLGLGKDSRDQWSWLLLKKTFKQSSLF